MNQVIILAVLVTIANAVSYQQKYNGYKYDKDSTYLSDKYLTSGHGQSGSYSRYSGSYSSESGDGYLGGLSLTGGHHLDQDLVSRLAASVHSSDLSGPTVVGTGISGSTHGSEHVEEVFEDRTITKPGREIIIKARTKPKTVTERVVTGRYVSKPGPVKFAVVAIPQKSKVEFIPEPVSAPQIEGELPPKVIEVEAERLKNLGIGNLENGNGYYAGSSGSYYKKNSGSYIESGHNYGSNLGSSGYYKKNTGSYIGSGHNLGSSGSYYKKNSGSYIGSSAPGYEYNSGKASTGYYKKHSGSHLGSGSYLGSGLTQHKQTRVTGSVSHSFGSTHSNLGTRSRAGTKS